MKKSDSFSCRIFDFQLLLGLVCTAAFGLAFAAVMPVLVSAGSALAGLLCTLGLVLLRSFLLGLCLFVRIVLLSLLWAFALHLGLYLHGLCLGPAAGLAALLAFGLFNFDLGLCLGLGGLLGSLLPT